MRPASTSPSTFRLHLPRELRRRRHAGGDRALVLVARRARRTAHAGLKERPGLRAREAEILRAFAQAQVPAGRALPGAEVDGGVDVIGPAQKGARRRSPRTLLAARAGLRVLQWTSFRAASRASRSSAASSTSVASRAGASPRCATSYCCARRSRPSPMRATRRCSRRWRARRLRARACRPRARRRPPAATRSGGGDGGPAGRRALRRGDRRLRPAAPRRPARSPRPGST